MEKIEVLGKTFEVCRINEHLKVAALPDMAEKIHKGEGYNFLEVMDSYIGEVCALPLAFRTPPVFSFIVLPCGEMFQTLTGCPFKQGMAGAKISLDKEYPRTLAVDDIWFFCGFGKFEDIKRKVGLCHELAHTVHSHWFTRMANEGFAELLPHYLMDLEAQNPQHRKAVFDLTEKEMRSINDIETNGIFSAEDLIKYSNTQERIGYMSYYLWTLGLMKCLEEKYQLDKFGAANLLLEKFSELDHLTLSEKAAGVAELVGVDSCVLINSLKLHLEGQNFLRQKFGN